MFSAGDIFEALTRSRNDDAAKVLQEFTGYVRTKKNERDVDGTFM